MVVWDVRSAWIVLWNHGGTMVEPWRRRRWRAQSKFWIKIARLRGRPEGLKSETEHVSECVWEALASAVQSVCVCVSVSSCSFFLYASSVAFADGLTGSCVQHGIKHLSELCTGLHQSPKKPSQNRWRTLENVVRLVLMADFGFGKLNTWCRTFVSPFRQWN